MATVVTWHGRNQAAMADKSAVKEPKQRTLGTEGGRDEIAPGGTQTHNSVAPISMPAACGLRVCSKAAVAGSGCDDEGLRRGMASSRMKKGRPVVEARTTVASPDEGRHGLPPECTKATVATGGGGAGRGRLPNGIDTGLRQQGVSSPTTRPQPPRSRLPNGHEAPQRARISRPAARREDSTVAPLFPAVG